MLFKFSEIPKDSNGNIESPTLILKTLHGEEIAPIGDYHDLSIKFRFNEVTEISFEVPSISPVYDRIVGMRIVTVEPFGDFILMQPSEKGDGIKISKSVTGYSREYEFNWKSVYIAEGTYNFWNPFDRDSTILQICLEQMPNWSIGEVSEKLIGRYRTFDLSENKLYDFMMNTLQQTYNCIFQFDTQNKIVNVMAAEDALEEMAIFLSYDNLLENVDVSELTDEIVTVLSPSGADPITIRNVNPLGTNKMYNLDYFISSGDIPKGIATKWNLWKSVFTSYQSVFGALNMAYNSENANYALESANLVSLRNELKALEYTRSAVLEGVAAGDEGKIPDYIKQKAEETLTTNTDILNESLKEINQEISNKESEVEAQEALVEKSRKILEKYTTEREAIVKACSFNTFFTDDELSVLQCYFKEEAMTDDTFVLSTSEAYTTEDTSSTFLDETVFVENTQITKCNFAETFDEVYENIDNLDVGLIEEINAELNKGQDRNLYNLAGGTFTINTIGGEIVSGSIDHNNTEGTILMSMYLKDFYDSEGNTYPSATINIKCDAYNYKVTARSISFTSPNFNVFLTRNVTEYQQQTVEQELYDYADDCLKRLAYPSYQFSIDSGNFVFAKEFEPFKNQLEMGKTLALSLNDETVIRPILIGVDLDYENAENFSLTFSDKYRTSESTFDLVDLLSDTINAANSVDFNKFNYASFTSSGAKTQVREYMESALDVAKNNVLSSTGQAISWDNAGLHLRKYKNDGINFEPEQIRIINNNIVFTDDAWSSVKMAIGEFKDKNTGVSWGVVAPSIVGTLLAGENLVIENATDDGVMQFKVDSSGAYLNNSTFLLQYSGENGDGKMLLDPKYGLVGGTKDIYTVDGTTVSPSFIDDSGNIVFDDDNMPQNSNFFLDLRTGKAYFRGVVHATEGYFSGVVKASDFQDSSGKSMLNTTGQITADYLDLKGLNINNNFIVDDSGNVTINGGSISWSAVTGTDEIDKRITAAQDAADNADSMATTARSLARQIGNGTYDLKNYNSFIKGKIIYSPEIVAGKFYAIEKDEATYSMMDSEGFGVYLNSTDSAKIRLGVYTSSNVVMPYLVLGEGNGKDDSRGLVKKFDDGLWLGNSACIESNKPSGNGIFINFNGAITLYGNTTGFNTTAVFG